MVSSVGSVQNQAMDLLQQRKSQILEKLKNGDAEDAIVTGGNAFTESVWNKMLEGVDEYLDEVKEEQQIRFAKMDEEQQEKELLQKRLMQKEMQAESNNKKEAIAIDAKCQQMQQAMDETVNSISGSTTIVFKEQEQSGAEVAAEQIAELFRDKE